MAVKKIGEILVEAGLISTEQLEEAFKESKDLKGIRLGSILIKKGYATELDIAQTLSFQLNIPFVDISTAAVDPAVLELVSEKLAKKYQLIPLCQDGKVLSVAMADPLNLNAIDDIRFSTCLDVAPSVATLSDVTFAINRYYHLKEPIEKLMGEMERDRLVEVIHESEDPDADVSEQVKKSYAPPIIKMVDSMIVHGVERRASDIHLEPQENSMILRLRVDGIMMETMQLPKWVQGPVISRLKLMAKMDITERRVSQDGRIKVRLGSKNIDIRVSTLPTQWGETVVMRLLDPQAALLDLKRIGLQTEDIERAVGLIERPQGIILVTGPTGSGKTSTLYAMISHIKTPRINIITIEDPIEYELKKVNQVAVNEKAGLGFSYILRSVLRQDPDIILVGEMRDAETAIIAHQASMTGHLVFSTLHTNDAVSSIIRLKNMGVPQYMVASALNGIVAQRLVRMICAQCKEAYTPAADELKKAGFSGIGKGKLFRGKGCKNCGNTGYSGRVGIFEILALNDKIRELISEDAPESELYKEAAASGMAPLRTDGIKKVAAGLTTLGELSRVIYLPKDVEKRPDSFLKSAGAKGESCPYCGHSIEKHCPACGKKV